MVQWDEKDTRDDMIRKYRDAIKKYTESQSNMVLDTKSPGYREFLANNVGYHDLMAEKYDDAGNTSQWNKHCKQRDLFYQQMKAIDAGKVGVIPGA